MPFWDYEPEQEQRQRDSALFRLRMNRTFFNRMARESVQARGIDPDTIPALSEDLDLETSTMTKKELGARAQSLGVSVDRYRGAKPEERTAAASMVGQQYARRQKLREQGLSDQQISIWDKVSRRAAELAPEGDEEELQRAQEKAVQELSFDEKGVIAAGGGFMGAVGRAIEPVMDVLKTAEDLWFDVNYLLAGQHQYEETEPDVVPKREEYGLGPFWERGAELSRPVAKPILKGVAEPFEQGELGFEAVTGVPAEGKVSGKITGDVAEDILTEVINPAGIILVVPFAGQGIRAGMSTRMVAAKLVSNLLGTGMEPELVRGTLRGASAAARGGPRAVANLPKATKEALDRLGGFTQHAVPSAERRALMDRHSELMGYLDNIMRPDKSKPAKKWDALSREGFPSEASRAKDLMDEADAVAGRLDILAAKEEGLLPGAVSGATGPERVGGGFTRAPRTRTLRGGPATPTIQEYQRHYTEMGTAVEGANKQVSYIREEVAAGRMDARAMDEATVRLSDARANLRQAKTDLSTVIFKNDREEILAAARASGVHDENILNKLGEAFDRSVTQVPAQEMLMNASATRHWLANAVAHITGTPPGVVGRLAHHRDILLSALRRYSSETVNPHFKELQKSLNAEIGNIRFTGPKKYSQMAEGEYKAHHIIQHPEMFDGMSPALKAQMDKAQELMHTRLETAKALGYPIEALDNAYLEQLWEIPGRAIGSHFLPGRVSVAKPRLFDDYFKGLTQGYTPQPMSVEELMQHSTGLLDQAISDAWMKQEIVRRFGTKHPGKVAAGQVKFEHALYKDWYGPAEISSWLDEMEAPVGRRLRQASNVSAAFRGTVFGLTDIAVSGVQFPLTLAHGGMQVAVGSLNRSLQHLGLPNFHIYMQDETFLGRAVDAVSNGLELTWGPSAVRRGGGTVVKYVPGLGPVEKAASKTVDWAAQAQFGYALSGVRLRMYEGNLIALKLSGENIFDPRVRRLAAEWANSASGASRGPMVKGRRAVEGTLLTSVQMTRGNLSVYGQLVKSLGPKAGKGERLRAAMTLANLAAYTYGIQYLFNEVLGDGPIQWIPGRSDWATIRIGGRTVPIIPQRSILRGMDKSIKILMEEVGATDTDRYSFSDLAMAWAQVAIGKASPLAGIVPGLAGYGFEPGTGKFEMGGLSAEGRIVGALPIPPLVEQAGWQERDELSLAIAGLGFNPYDTSSGTLLREEFVNKNGEELNWESPAHREIIEGDSRLNRLWEKSRSESREYGSEAAITSEQIRVEIADAEVDKGIVRHAEEVLAGDPFAQVNWRDARSEFLIWRSGKWDNKLTGREPRTEIGKLVNEYYGINPKSEEFTDPDGETNWSAFDEARQDVLDRMPKADADAIRNNEKFDSPIAEKADKQFRDAQAKLRSFWDVEEEIWGKLRANSPALRPYASMKELEEAKIAELTKQGFPQDELRWRLSRIPIISQAGSIIQQERLNYRMKHPEVDALLVKWYGNTPARERVTGRPKRPSPPRPPRP